MLCSRVQNLLSAYCDRELTGEDMLRVRRHLSECSSCRTEYESLHGLKRLLSAAPQAEPPAPFRMELIEARLHGAPALQRSPMLDLFRPMWALLSRPLPTLPLNFLQFRLSTPPLVAASAVAVVVLAAALVQRPQPPDAVTANVPTALAADRPAVLPLPARDEPAYAAPGLEPVYYQYYTGSQLTHVGPADLMPWDGRVSSSVNLVHWQRVQKTR